MPTKGHVTMLGPPNPAASTSRSPSRWRTSFPPDHFYRHLEAKLDLSFVRDWTRELYAERGRPSIDPVVFFKLQLVMFFEGIRSERQAHRDRQPQPRPPLVPGLCPRRGPARPLQPDPHPAATGSTSSSASSSRSSTCARRRAWSGVGSSTSTPRRSRPTPASRPSSRASTTKPRPTWPTCSRTRPTDDATEADTDLPPGIVPLPIDAASACPQGAIRRGGCWRSGGWIRTAPRIAATGAPATSASAPPTPMPRHVGLGRDPPRLPRPLRGGWRQAPHHPRRPGDPGGCHGEPGHARSAVAGLLSMEALARTR